ncbi:hypothetical protein LCGC14_1268540 [marine sediment metagenome]|uniref:Uncharacterized protein n=1 Tax=marine sediment metagenome TaxID=412755 RepID=A0A0F9P1X2_9ZZZZ
MVSNMKRGVFGKYILSKADGSDVDCNACYFVLRLDEDPAAQEAMRVYAAKCGNRKLANDITRCLDWLDAPPVCTCGGGRDSDEICMFHDGGFFGHPVWRHEG